jgi:hypothetical protein
LCILVSVTLFPSLMPQVKVTCLKDNFFEWTAGANQYLAASPTIKKGTLIIIGIMMDIILLI